MAWILIVVFYGVASPQVALSIEFKSESTCRQAMIEIDRETPNMKVSSVCVMK